MNSILATTMAANDGEKKRPIHSNAWLNINPKLPRDMLNSGKPILGQKYLWTKLSSLSLVRDRLH